MSLAMFIVAGLSACAWAYLFFARGFFWLVERSLRVPRSDPVLARAENLHVVAIVPARNEAGTIGRSVTSLLLQTVANVHVIVVDDASTDGTAAAAQASAGKLNASNRLTIIPGQPLPAGWTGKLWAVQQGVEHAMGLHPDFLLFTDADIEHGVDTVASLVDVAQAGPYDLASYMVKLHCSSSAEKLLIPAFVYFFFQLYPPAWIADPNSRTAGAAGGCMLVRPSALSKGGGIAAIRSAIIDDCALAGAIKHSGGRVWLGLTNDSHSLRQYRTFSEIGGMIARTAFNQLRHSTLLLLGTILGLLITYIAPVLLLFGWPTVADIARVGLPAAAYLMMTVSYLPMVRFYRLNPLWALTLPFASLFYMAATIWSAIQYWSGRGGQWKGRAQDTA